MVKGIKYIFRVLGIALILYSAFILASPVSWGDHAGLHEELPLGIIEGVHVSRSGDIYLGSQSYSRIQVYNKNGRFLRGYSILTRPFNFQLLSDQNQIKVSGESGSYILDADTGEVLEHTKKRDYDLQCGNIANDPMNNKFMLAEWSWLWPRIKRISPDGTDEIVIMQPFSLWVCQSPQPAYLFVIVGMLCVICTIIPQIRQQLRDYMLERSQQKKENISITTKSTGF